MLVAKLKRYLAQKGFKALCVKVSERLQYKMDACKYVRDNSLTDEQITHQLNTQFANKVLISVCVPVYNTDKAQFEQMLYSVLNQTYPYFELCIVDASSAQYTYIKDIIDKASDDRIKYKKLYKNKGIVGNSNEACAMASGEYIALLDHDDVLSRDALYCVKNEIDNGADYIYSDEASFSKSINKPDIIHFKPDYSIFNLRGNNFICHLSVFRKRLFDEVGGFRQGFDGSQDHDLTLRICEISKKVTHIPRVLYYWRVHKNSVAMDISAKPYCLTTGVKAVESHLNRMGINANVSNAVSDSAVYRVDYKIHIKPVVINSIYNIGGVTSEYIIVADKNMEINQDTINELAQYIQLDNVGAVCGKVVNNGRIQCGGISIKKDICYDYENTSIYSEGYMKRLKYAQATDSINPYVFAVKKTIVNAIGGFDESLNDFEKVIDFSLKVKNMGYEVVFNPYATVFGNVEKIIVSEKFKRTLC